MPKPGEDLFRVGNLSRPK